MTRRLSALLGVLALLLLGGVVAPGAASAATTRDVRITFEGPDPASLTVARGDVVRFVNADAFPHRVVSSSGGWEFDTGTLFPGQAYVVPSPLTAPGTYGYEGAGLDDFEGVVVVPAPVATPRPAAPAPAPAPEQPAPEQPAPAAPVAPPAQPAPAASTAPAPAATGGTGVADGPPPLAGGVLPSPPSALPADGPLPEVAPVPEPVSPLGDPVVAEEDTGAGAVPVAVGDLPGLGTAVEARAVGLPVALALVLAGGVLSLLVRLLLAEAPRPDAA